MFIVITFLSSTSQCDPPIQKLLLIIGNPQIEMNLGASFQLSLQVLLYKFLNLSLLTNTIT